MRGFSLLEVLVVLVILGMAAALVVPSLGRTLDRVTEVGERDDVVRRLGLLPAVVRTEGRDREWKAGEPLVMPGLGWPLGWGVSALTDLRVAASGFCSGADVQVRSPSGTRRYRLDAPDCRVVDADAP